MQDFHKHIARLVLISSVCLLTSIYGYYYACEWMAKWAFAHQSYFAADELILLTIPRTDLSHQNEFLVDEGEFEWQGEMVDVIHRELRADTLYIYGFRDKAETKLRQEAAWLYPDTAHPNHQPVSSRSTQNGLSGLVRLYCPFGGNSSGSGLCLVPTGIFLCPFPFSHQASPPGSSGSPTQFVAIAPAIFSYISNII